MIDMLCETIPEEEARATLGSAMEPERTAAEEKTAPPRSVLAEIPQIISVGILTLIGGGLRLAFLFQPPRYDEMTTFFAYACNSAPMALTKNNPPCNPLFHSLLVNASSRIFGDVEWAIRLPAFIAGVLLIPLTYLVFRKLYNKWVGMIAAMLVTPSSILIAYSTNARGLMLQAAFFLVLILLAIRVKQRKSTWGWAGIVAVGTLSFFTLPTTLYFFGAVVLWLAISAFLDDIKENRKTFLLKLSASVVITGVFSAVLYIPVIVRSGLESVTSNPMVKSLPFDYFLRGSARLLRDTWNSWNLDVPLVIGVVLVLGLLVAIVFHKRIAKDRVDLALVIIAWCLLVTVFLRSVADERHWIPLLPIFFGFSAAGLHYIGSRALDYWRKRGLKAVLGPVPACAIIVAVAILMSVVVVGSRSPYQNAPSGFPSREMSFKDARTVASALKGTVRPGDIIYVDHLAVPALEYYFLKENTPLGYLYGNIHGAENTSSPIRIIIVEAFGEGHTIPGAVRDRVSAEELDRAWLLKEFDNSRILVIEEDV